MKSSAASLDMSAATPGCSKNNAANSIAVVERFRYRLLQRHFLALDPGCLEGNLAKLLAHFDDNAVILRLVGSLEEGAHALKGGVRCAEQARRLLLVVSL